MICVIYAHPYPTRSRANRVLLDAIRPLPDLHVRSLYDHYPDFDIDVAAEQQALLDSRLVVWLHPLYWYSVPGLLKHWFDKVLAYGWAYGEGGTALRGKHCLWVATTGADAGSYAPDGIHSRPFRDFAAPVEQTARFCGMSWLPPFIVHGAHTSTDAALREHGKQLRERLEAYREHFARPATEHAA